MQPLFNIDHVFLYLYFVFINILYLYIFVLIKVLYWRSGKTKENSAKSQAKLSNILPSKACLD